MRKLLPCSRRPLAVAVSFALATAVSRRATATQYDVVVLDQTFGLPTGIYQGMVVGIDRTGLPTVWTNNGTTVTHLAFPPGFSGVGGGGRFAIYRNQIGGAGDSTTDNLEHALLWNGTGSAAIDLGTNSEISGIYNGVQAGADNAGRAAIWRGTAASLVDLTPPGALFYSDATGIWGSEVSGRWYNNPSGSNPHPAVWTSLSPSGFVDLSGPNDLFGAALAVSRGQQAGYVGAAGTNHAAIWSGTATSFQDLAPAGTTASELRGTNGIQQVGDVSFKPEIGGLLPEDHHGAVWNGTAGSYQLLPAPFGQNTLATGSLVYGIDGNGDIIGVAGTGSWPVMWVPHRLPGDANFDGTVDFSDLLILAQNYGQPGEWVDGEFSGAGTVDFADLLMLAQNYGQTAGSNVRAAAVVPEPTAGVAISIVSMSLLQRRRIQRTYSQKCM